MDAVRQDDQLPNEASSGPSLGVAASGGANYYQPVDTSKEAEPTAATPPIPAKDEKLQATTQPAGVPEIQVQSPTTSPSLNIESGQTAQKAAPTTSPSAAEISAPSPSPAPAPAPSSTLSSSSSSPSPIPATNSEPAMTAPTSAVPTEMVPAKPLSESSNPTPPPASSPATTSDVVERMQAANSGKGGNNKMKAILLGAGAIVLLIVGVLVWIIFNPDQEATTRSLPASNIETSRIQNVPTTKTPEVDLEPTNETDPLQFADSDGAVLTVAEADEVKLYEDAYPNAVKTAVSMNLDGIPLTGELFTHYEDKSQMTYIYVRLETSTTIDFEQHIFMWVMQGENIIGSAEAQVLDSGANYMIFAAEVFDNDFRDARVGFSLEEDVSVVTPTGEVQYAK